MATTLDIPESLKPEDGRFGSSPSKIRLEQITALGAGTTTLLGTLHRQAPVKQLVASTREGLRESFHLPRGYEVALGNDGTSAFWEIAYASLITCHAAFDTYGSFNAKFVAPAANALFLENPVLLPGEPGTCRLPKLTGGMDTYCWAHSETSADVVAPTHRVPGSREVGVLTIIDDTSAAGALPVDISQTDVCYFSPQKAFGADGGLWVAILFPEAIDRAACVESSAHLEDIHHWVPSSLSLTTALNSSRKDQTLNTPAVAALIMVENQIRWLDSNGGLARVTTRYAKSASVLYSWVERSEYTAPFVVDTDARSSAVVIIDLGERVQASQILSILRENGIMGAVSYRKLGRNQLHVSVFPSVEPADIMAFTKCADYVVKHL